MKSVKSRVLCLSTVLSLGSGALYGDDVPLRDWQVPATTWSPPAAGRLSALAVPTPVLNFIAIAPCRLADTRPGSGFGGAYGPPALVANAARSFPITGQCGIPATAQAVSFNFTVVNAQGPGDIRTFPSGGGAPLVSTLNYVGGQTIANAAIVPMGTGGAASVQADVSGTDLIIDVNGYFAPDAVSASKIVWVGPVGTAAQNGSALLAALAGISGASATNGYLLKIEPGVYDLGATPFAMKQYVDVEGSGEGVTTIQMGTCSTGVVQGADNAELRLLTVACLGGGTGINGIAISTNGVSTRITQVTARSQSPTSGNGYAVSVTGASPVLTNVTASTTSGGLQTFGISLGGASTAILRDVRAKVTGGGSTVGDMAVSILDGQPLLEGVSANVTLNSGSGVKAIGIANGGTLAIERNVTAFASGAPSCYGILNGQGTFGGAIPLISDSKAEAYGTNLSFGIWNVGATPTLWNVTAIARSGATFNDGMHSEQSSVFTVVGGTYISQDGTGAALSNSDSSGTVTNAALLASGSGTRYGIYNDASTAQTLFVSNSKIQGVTRTVRNGPNYTTRVGGSLMDGGAVSNTGTALVCAGVYDEAFAFFASTCP